MTKKTLVCFLGFALSMTVSMTTAPGQAHENMIANGGFEAVQNGQPKAWSALWTREAGQGTFALEQDNVHGGAVAVRLEHRGQKDWCFNTDKRIACKPGDLFVLTGWVRQQGPGQTMLSVILYDESGNALDWSYGEQAAPARDTWVKVTSRFAIPKKGRAVLPRILGYGSSLSWWDDLSMICEGNVFTEQDETLAQKVTIGNGRLQVVFDLQDTTLCVTDSQTGTSWRQRAVYHNQVPLSITHQGPRGFVIDWLHLTTGLALTTRFELANDAPELLVRIAGEGELGHNLQFPQPFVSDENTTLVVPMNEGISYPVDDSTIPEMRLISYGGHGICMAFWGVTDGQQGHMAIIETPDDAAIRICRVDGKLCIVPEWEAQKGQFGYERRLRYVFFAEGGHVAMCKRYRNHARQAGKLKTLREKRQENPNVDLLVGAVNVWCWERNEVAIVKELQSLGIERILWSHRAGPETIRTMNQMPKVLTSRYDIYQDLMDPDIVRTKLRSVHPDWTQAGWPHDTMWDENGIWRKGWQVTGKDGLRYPCGVLCDRQAIAHAQRRVPEELQTHPYRSRFIDTTTASSWRECYHPAHPMTRGQSRHWKMELLRYMSEEAKLVTGSETGHDAAVPYVHYFEGMLSLGPYRVPEAGRNMIEPWDTVPERVAKFQVGHQYRLPLWELVYHDCVVAQWYWGDYNNKLPKLWDKRDLFNLLYGTPPMFMFNRSIWEEHKERFVQSYHTICPTVRDVGYEEMLDHRFLTQDRSVQQTLFANGLTITVNFGDQDFDTEDGAVIKPQAYRLERIPLDNQKAKKQ